MASCHKERIETTMNFMFFETKRLAQQYIDNMIQQFDCTPQAVQIYAPDHYASDKNGKIYIILAGNYLDLFVRIDGTIE